jgi:hypothetical protein
VPSTPRQPTPPVHRGSPTAATPSKTLLAFLQKGLPSRGSSLGAGASEAFALAKRTVIVTPLGGTTTAQNGAVGETAGFSALATASARLADFYLAQAQQLMPTLWIESGTPARLVLQEGLPLEGLPTTTTLSSRGLP